MVQVGPDKQLPFVPHPDERVHEIRAHWIMFAKWLLAPALLLFALLVLVGLLGPRLDMATRFMVVVLGLLVVFLWGSIAYQEWNRDYLYVTNKRIVMRRGYVRRTLKMFPLGNVMYVLSEDTPFSRALGYGKIDVVSPGEKGPEAASVLDPAPNPSVLANEIMFLIDRPATPGEPQPVRVVGPPPSWYQREGRSDAGGNPPRSSPPWGPGSALSPPAERPSSDRN